MNQTTTVRIEGTDKIITVTVGTDMTIKAFLTEDGWRTAEAHSIGSAQQNDKLAFALLEWIIN